MLNKENQPPMVSDQGGQPYNREQVTRALTIIESEKEWRRMNPALFIQEVENYAVHEMEQMRPFSMQRILERIRWKDHVNDAGQPVKVSNDYGAIWARLLLKKYPSMKHFLRVKPSIFDYVKPSW